VVRPSLKHAHAVDEFVMTALQKQPGARFQSAREMRAALHRLRATVSGAVAMSQRITLPQEPSGLDRTQPAPGTPGDVARTIPDPSPDKSARPPSTPPLAATAPLPQSSTTERAPGGISTLGVVVAAAIGAVVAATITYFLVRGS
jgi:hypothetical protein